MADFYTIAKLFGPIEALNSINQYIDVTPWNAAKPINASVVAAIAEVCSILHGGLRENMQGK